jgi:8-oxo-dGTP diphosphatase
MVLLIFRSCKKAAPGVPIAKPGGPTILEKNLKKRSASMNTFEIELRYEVLDPQQLAQFLSSLKQLHQKRDIDVYLDTHDAALYQRGIFIRLRNNKKLDFKFNRACLDNPQLPIQDYCEEYSFTLPLQPDDFPPINELLVSLNLQPCISADIENLKNRNNFINHYVVDKLRTSYQHASFTLSVDEVADLGTFLEIELMAKSIENIDTIKAKMEELLAHLRLKPLKTGYGTLLLQKNDFKHYLLGRFILEEDKKYRTTPQHPRAHPRVGVAVFITNGNKILLGKRKNAHGDGSWATPGGHLEFGESLEQCARREVMEETGLTLQNIRRGPYTNDVFIDEHKHYITIYMIADYTMGLPRVMEPEKCEQWEWFAWNDLPQPLFLPIENLLKQEKEIPHTPLNVRDTFQHL